jgi:hypothetical protein
MELPTEVRCQIYECLLLVPGATSYGTIFIEDLKYRKNLRRLQQDGRESLPTELMRHIAKDYGLPDRDENYFDTLLDHNGQVKCLLHVDILRVNRQINEEAEDIFYGRNKVSIAPNLYKQNEPLHHQLTEGWIPSPIRYLQLELHESGIQGCELPIYHQAGAIADHASCRAAEPIVWHLGIVLAPSRSTRTQNRHSSLWNDSKEH